MSDIPASDNPRQKDQARSIHRHGAVQITPAWPEEEPDPQFDPGTARPVEMSEKDNDKGNPTNGITEETVATPAADRDTTPVDDAAVPEDSIPLTTYDYAEGHQEEPQVGAPTAQDEDQEGSTTAMPNVDPAADLGTTPVIDVTVSEDSTPLTTHDAEGYREEPQVSAPAAQDEAQENIHTEPAINNDAGVNTTAEETISDAEATPAPDGDNPHDTAEPDSINGTVAESEVVKEAVDQILPTKTALERGKEWLSLFQVLTEDGPAEIKDRALVQFTSQLDEFKNAMLGKTLEQRAKIVSATLGIINPVMMKADALRCICAIMIGELANTVKKDVPHGDWTDISRKYFPQIEPRDLQQCMRLANVREIARYCYLGKTKLIALAAIASKGPFSSADDPIGMVLINVQGHPQILPEEYERLSLAAISNSNLKKLGLFIDQHVLRDIYEYGEEITDKDIAEMLAWKERHENGESELTPTDFLSATLKNDGKRVFELTDPNEKKGNGKGKPKTPTIPEINSTFEKTRETVQLALEKLDPSKLKVDRELYHTLMTTLKTFGETVFPS
ncbi:hypothetical protein DVDV_2273 [Desulfovibrio sp. DV]|uniref:hypothetical protein n=1 Tax=Desulfovibrio sp. DV TaxID=1844708 RepID=UPI00094B8D63|nr:hypothetical protein [Desulfovibrio sp. DV]OLN27144.1 hypothetical protein DVDV_2273 [Desulfovibrio sp. DV]